jgi:hypothetical protein
MPFVRIQWCSEQIVIRCQQIPQVSSDDPGGSLLA